MVISSDKPENCEGGNDSLNTPTQANHIANHIPDSIPLRYSRNIGAITIAEQELLLSKRVFIAGCGGLGGHIFSNLLRLGIGHITAVDGDCFDETNLNRQLLSTLPALGRSKAATAAEYAALINPKVEVITRQVYLTDDNCEELIKGQDLVIDALDNYLTRRILAKGCDALNIPYVFGAIRDWLAMVSFFPAGKASAFLPRYASDDDSRESKSSLSFTPAFCASLQCAEAVKYLLNRGELMAEHTSYFDLLNGEYIIIPNSDDR